MCALFLLLRVPLRFHFHGSPTRRTSAYVIPRILEEGQKKRVEVHKDNGSDIETGEEAGDHDLENDACSLFHRLSENPYKLDRLAVVLYKNIYSQFGLIFSDPEDIFNELRSIDSNYLLKIVQVIFSLEREQLKVNKGNISYKSTDVFLKENHKSYIHLILKSAVEGFSETSKIPVKKVRSIDAKCHKTQVY